MVPLGEKSLSILLLGLFTYDYTLSCHFLPIVWAHKVGCSWHCFWPQHRDAGNQPWCLSHFVFHEATSTDPLE